MLVPCLLVLSLFSTTGATRILIESFLKQVFFLGQTTGLQYVLAPIESDSSGTSLLLKKYFASLYSMLTSYLAMK